MTITNVDELKQEIALDCIAQTPLEAATFLEKLPAEDIKHILGNVQTDKVTAMLNYLSVDTLLFLANYLTAKQTAHVLMHISIEKAAKIFNDFDVELKNKISSLLPMHTLHEIAEIAKYPQGTAGSMMDAKVLGFYPDMTVMQAIQRIKERSRRGIRLLFIINKDGELDSMVSMQSLMMADGYQKLSEISKPIPAVVNDMDPQEDIVDKLAEYRLTDIPVQNINGKFVGVVRHHTLFKATEEELTKDIGKMVGVSEDEKALSSVMFAVRKRLPWLEINLLTAFLAASVVGIFESTIAKYTALAVLLPVVAGQSGNTGAQALAVTMRGLALKEVRVSHWLVLALKEVKISFVTGLVVAATTALGVFFWSRSIGLTFIIGVSMVLSMVLASLSGALVPIVLKKLKQDPASSSSIILTTVTDVCGFFSFLGIATLLSRFI